jgi:outer membrane protein OmpA-like peptidoglycan-associated protein
MVRPRAQKGPAAFLVAVLLVPLHHGDAATSGEAAPPKSGEVLFSTGTVEFPTSTFTFPTSTFTFPASLEAKETATTIEVALAADVLFDFDKADIRAAAEATLHDVAQLIRDKARGPVAIQGFTDALGTDAYNQRLSERRAVAVKAWLVAHEAFAPRLFTTSGLGARNPVAPNRNSDGSDNPEGRQRNRRVTLIIRK